MIPLRDARVILSQLQRLSLVENQAVPKTAGKSRTPLAAQGDFHLWTVDMPRVYGLLLATLYKTLGNILQRQAMEIEKKSLVLAREGRTARQGGREMLAGKDQEDLADLDDTLRKLTVARVRSEMVVFLLRDLPDVPRK